MNNNRLKLIKQELMQSGKSLSTFNIVKPAVFFYSEEYTIVNEGSEDKWNRSYINNEAKRSISCYGITNAGLLLEALVLNREYLPDEEWEIIAFTDIISICPLVAVGNIRYDNRQSIEDVLI